MIAKELITDSILPLKGSDTGAYALGLMDDYHLSHLPVVNDTELLGLISETDILGLNDFDEAIGNYNLTLNRAWVTEGLHIFEVIKAFSSRKLTLLPVLNDRNHYLGSITMANLVQHLSGIAAVDNPGGIIVLEVNNKDYLLTEIAGIVESNDAKVLSMYITSIPDSTLLEITLKINRIDIGPVLQTFFRYNYTVKASWSHEDAYHDGLQDRFDALMNYLNI